MADVPEKVICDECKFTKEPHEHRCHGDNAMVDGLITDAPCECEKCLATKYGLQPLKVETCNSVYLFGEVNKDGKRSVSREGRPLDFSLCQIVFLAEWQSMTLNCFDGSRPYWCTSGVKSIMR